MIGRWVTSALACSGAMYFTSPRRSRPMALRPRPDRRPRSSSVSSAVSIAHVTRVARRGLGDGFVRGLGIARQCATIFW